MWQESKEMESEGGECGRRVREGVREEFHPFPSDCFSA